MKEVKHMVKTWIADVEPLEQPEVYQRYYELAPKERREKADRIVHMRDKMLSIGAWSLYEIAKKVNNISPQAIYNFSHSGQYVLCAIEDNQNQDVKVGCDLEQVGKSRMNIAKRFFRAAEYEYIQSHSSSEKRISEFYRYWVLKESFMKATRLGMKMPLDAFEIQIEKDKTPQLIKMPQNVEGHYYYKEYEIKADARTREYKAAVCTTTQDIAPMLFWEQL